MSDNRLPEPSDSHRRKIAVVLSHGRRGRQGIDFVHEARLVAGGRTFMQDPFLDGSIDQG